MLAARPYQYISDDVLYATHGRRHGQSREDSFATGQPCLRASPLAQHHHVLCHADIFA